MQTGLTQEELNDVVGAGFIINVCLPLVSLGHGRSPTAVHREQHSQMPTDAFKLR